MPFARYVILAILFLLTFVIMHIVIGRVFFVCASILALLFNRMYNCIEDIELKRQFKLNKKIILKMCNADVKINNGSSGFSTTFILFQPTTVFFVLLCFYTTQMTIDAKSKNNPLHS